MLIFTFFHFQALLSFTKYEQRCMFDPSLINTVRLLTHVLCKPTHFFFHSFIATMSHSPQISLSSVMKDWADICYIWGMCSYIIYVVYIYIYVVSYLVWRGLLCLSYPTHIWNAHVAEFFLEIINAKNEAWNVSWT